jgi:LysR family glycine cleavage system transcriptional activator
MKRYMPPLNHLRAFEAAVRHESFTKAAHELNVTQGAISRHIRDLEDYLGFKLFQRINNTLQVPRESRQFADTLTKSFDQIHRASQELKLSKRRTILTVRGYTNFIVRWLIPRLPEFQAHHPKVEIRISAGREEEDFSTDDIDLAIRFGRGNWPRLHSEFLFSMDMVPVCSPALMQRLELKRPEDVLRTTVYNSYLRRDEWLQWFKLVSDLPFKPVNEVLTEDLAVAHQCVISGMGMGLTQRHYVIEDLAAGRLVIPFDVPLRNDSGFYVVCPVEHVTQPKNAAFREWLLSVVRSQEGAPPDRVTGQSAQVVSLPARSGKARSTAPGR